VKYQLTAHGQNWSIAKWIEIYKKAIVAVVQDGQKFRRIA